ncbi:hypothetical protein CBR_g3709 [Chara braunii]|uniref:Uncharacterized protein n=1 Tax=Chara braunii TaxID=69332 RepID=A0A388KG50_CHABU|nr:hypothetical protein CBR_g3709 [Chara braunii]|eukprot:GBG69009.1 hypothetical protein CBR_g3709 [Chara braunii]
MPPSNGAVKQQHGNARIIKALQIDKITRETDLKEEVLGTALAYLEVGEDQHVRVRSQAFTTCSITFHKRSPEDLRRRSSLVDAILRRAHHKQGHFIVDVPAVAMDLRVSLNDVQEELNRLQAGGELNFEMKNASFCFDVVKQPNDLCELTLKLAQHMKSVEDCKIAKLDTMYKAAAAAMEGADAQKTFQRWISDYFESSKDPSIKESPPPGIIKASRYGEMTHHLFWSR